jgi:uncharacterized membrane protein
MAWCVVLFFSIQMIQLSVQYLVPPFRTDIDFLLSKQDVLPLDAWRWAFYVHISTSLLTILSGLTQFSKTIYRQYAALHRIIGKIYVFTVLVLSAPSGFIMALYANGGNYTRPAFVVLSLLWWWFTWCAYQAARNGAYQRHARFMMRSYALTWSAVSLRVLQFFFGYTHILDYETAYLVAAYGGWLINLLIVESALKAGALRYYFATK